ncbi:peptide-methionine (R)-S-oxide reductase MsrB [Halpernia sp.]|uniref:peptide-methionine (R)-S-oxide reductase MsrB n=1 Tax=Halpernia sp. TaxID=2782209 RepID=UPI003A9541EE
MKSIIIKTSTLIFMAVLTTHTFSAQRIQEVNGKKIINPFYSRTDTSILKVSDLQWKKVLNKNLFATARKNNTEMAFTGKYNDFEGIGTYYCAVCGNALFKSDAKFSSTCGWPSFFETIRPKSVVYKKDYSLNMVRTEVRCGRCDAHLGHLFDDGPTANKKRYCMNSISLEFVPDKKMANK